MKIAIDISVLIESQRTGISVYVYRLIEALLETNQEDQFVLFGLAPLAKYDELKNIEFKKYPNVEIKIFRLPARLFRRAFLLWQKLDWPPIDSLIGPVDVVHSFNWWFPPQKSGKRIATLFDVTAIDHPEWHQVRTSQLDKIRLERIRKQADLVLTISESSKKDFLKFAPHLRTEVIYPAAAACFYQKLNKKEIAETIKKYDLKPGYILSVGTIEPRKNLARLIGAYLQANLRQPLVLVGVSGWKNNQIYELANRHSDKIILTGFVADADLPAIYQGARLFVYPSLYEGFGIPVIEAMVSGLPVISADNSSLPEVGGGAVKYIDATDVDQLSQALVDLVSNESLSNKLIQLNHQQIAKYSWKKSAQKLSKIYHQLV